MSKSEIRVGIVSDTHGLMRPEALVVLGGSDFIVHAGDIGGSEILDALSGIAPTTAVRGNNDKDSWATDLPAFGVLEAGSTLICVVHDIADLDVDPVAAGFQVVVSGHSHKSAIEWRDQVLFINPGSAGPRRFKLPVSVATLTISGSAISPRIVVLNV
jgi:uncharacterized protein